MDGLTLNPAGSSFSLGPAASDRTPSGLTSRQLSFAEILGHTSGSGTSGATPEQRSRAAAEQLVAVALVQPLLTQLHQSSNAAPPFAPTPAEKQIRALQDAEVARQITHAARIPLVERLARRMLDSAQAASAAPARPE